MFVIIAPHLQHHASPPGGSRESWPYRTTLLLDMYSTANTIIHVGAQKADLVCTSW